MNVETANSIRITRTINANPQQVFDAWTKADALQQWSCPEGATVRDVAVNLRVGGRYRIEMKMDEGPTHTAIGVYQLIEPPRRLVYTWKWEEMPEMPDSLVTVTFSAVGDSTEVEITHERFVDEKTASDHEKGWTSCMDKLERLFA